MSDHKLSKTLILVPDLEVHGGVSNYYKALQLNKEKSITYFQVNKAQQLPSIIALADLTIRYFRFISHLVWFRYEIIISNPSLEGVGKSFYRESIFILIARLFRRKTIVFFRGWAEPFEQRIRESMFKSFLFKISLAKADQFIVLGSIFSQKLVSMGVPANAKFQVESTVADSSGIGALNLSSKLSTYNEEFKILFLSRVEKIKGIYIVIDAFEKFKQKFPERNSSLIIAGDGPHLADTKSYVKRKSIKGVEFHGFVTGDSKRKLLLESHIMILPSFTEGLPNTILEGMLYGMPIIASTAGAIPEVVDQNVNGFLSNSKDPDVFSDFISRLSCNISLYEKMMITNHDTALQKFTTERVRERILKLLNKNYEKVNI